MFPSHLIQSKNVQLVSVNLMQKFLQLDRCFYGPTISCSISNVLSPTAFGTSSILVAPALVSDGNAVVVPDRDRSGMDILLFVALPGGCLGHIFSPAVPTPLQTAGWCQVAFS